MDRVVQNNAAATEESASAAEEMNAMADTMKTRSFSSSPWWKAAGAQQGRQALWQRALPVLPF
jgi:hypothetical protein